MQSPARYDRNFFIDRLYFYLYSPHVPLTEGVSGDEPESERDAAPAGWLVTSLRGPRVTVRLYYERPPFSGQYAQGQRVQTARGQIPKGIRPGVRSHSPRPKIGPRWSAERRASPGCAACESGLRGDARACVTGPLKGCPLAPERLSALRPLTSNEGEFWQASEDKMPREND